MDGVTTLAAAQTVPVRGDVDANIERHAATIRAAVHARPDIMVFPELSLTGYELDLAKELAFSERDPRLGPLVASASEHRTTLVVGAPVLLDARLHIGALIIAPDGRIDVYTKRRMGAFPASAGPDGVVPPAEASVFEPGERDPIVAVGARSAAVAVCADINAPAHAERAAARGASIYLAGMFVIPADLERDTATLRSYAQRHRMTVAFANYGGPSGGLPAAGSSAIWSPEGALLVRLPAEGSGVALATETEEGWRGEALAEALW